MSASVRREAAFDCAGIITTRLAADKGFFARVSVSVGRETGFDRCSVLTTRLTADKRFLARVRANVDHEAGFDCAGILTTRLTTHKRFFTRVGATVPREIEFAYEALLTYGAHVCLDIERPRPYGLRVGGTQPRLVAVRVRENAALWFDLAVVAPYARIHVSFRVSTPKHEPPSVVDPECES
jgi:hypothetical protein